MRRRPTGKYQINPISLAQPAGLLWAQNTESFTEAVLSSQYGQLSRHDAIPAGKKTATPRDPSGSDGLHGFQPATLGGEGCPIAQSESQRCWVFVGTAACPENGRVHPVDVGPKAKRPQRPEPPDPLASVGGGEMVPKTTDHRWPDVRNRGLLSVEMGRRAARIGADDAGAAQLQMGPLKSHAHRGARPCRTWGTVRPDADQERFPAGWNDPLELYGRWRRQLALPIFDPSIERMQARALAGRCGARWVWHHRHQLVALRKFMARAPAIREVFLPLRKRKGGRGDGPHP